ncbi:MAG TPA: GlsB/YeaQ/YmgE family stress response membrane protein, partial [Methyloceanibacter sp.]|nr:GlsB/YeaQ/YmgE family stress response membrane protein [Methyloceanibacter sp.]
AGVIVEGGGFGLLGNMLLGIVGAFIAALLFPRLGLGLTLGGGIVGAIVASMLGAVVLLLIVNLIQRLV